VGARLLVHVFAATGSAGSLNRVIQKTLKRESRKHGHRVIVECGEPESLKARKPENPKQGVQ
jgi:hypothetical protein